MHPAWNPIALTLCARAYASSVFGVHLALPHRALTLSQLQRLIAGVSHPGCLHDSG
ncbi:hypothetical protein AZE42_09366 [Rhizopogon vesiculosus]|uniref:Uncharacterized protein n=1 Tax=Rhizopogon vesiculosus TaxID=180088 RepID=A0A1J8QGR3_9AGAM|nr:hypothetical protein AZE42_09366 [Rhizopogon vesiculosus]